MGWATFFAIFLQTHLVTLFERIRGSFKRRRGTYHIGFDWNKLAAVVQGCQMVCFQTKNPNLGKFWRALD
jgi:hypothetical protein